MGACTGTSDKYTTIYLLATYIYIYIYRERERERERDCKPILRTSWAKIYTIS